MLEAPALNKRDIPAARTLTVENSLYLALCLAALALRLLGISGSQLTLAEATQALPAYHLAQGSGNVATSVGAVSPGLLSLQALAFWLFAGNDAWARLPVVLLTSLYPLAFWLLRPLIGRMPALAAAALLLLSPAWVAGGTLGLAGELAVVACLFALGFVVQASEQGDDHWLAAAGVAMGLALATSTEAWAALAITGLALLAHVGLFHGSLPLSRRQWGRLGIATGVSALVFGTAATLNPIGLQTVLDQAGQWLVSLWQRQVYALSAQTLLLFCYEPLLLYMGLLTVALVPPATAWRRALYIWTALALFLALATGRIGDGVVLLLPALALLTAEALIGVARRLQRLDPTLVLQSVGATVVLAVYGYVALTGFAVQEQWVYLLLAGTAIGIGAALLGLVGVRQGGGTALALLALVIVMILGAYQVGETWQGVSQRRVLAQELTYGPVGDGNLGDLIADIADISRSREGDPIEVPITIEEGSGALVAWYTRALRDVTWVREVPTDAQTLAVLTVQPQLETLASQYVGQDYRVSASWLPYFSDYRAFLRWVLYREAEGVQQQSVTLWVRNDTATGE